MISYDYGFTSVYIIPYGVTTLFYICTYSIYIFFLNSIIYNGGCNILIFLTTPTHIIDLDAPRDRKRVEAPVPAKEIADTMTGMRLGYVFFEIPRVVSQQS